MLKAIINAGTLKELIDVISTLVDEARFKLSSEEMAVIAVDPANIAMVSFKISSDAFESFEVASDGELGIDLTKLSDIVSMSGTESISLQVDDGKLYIKFLDLTYSMSLLDPSSLRKEPKLPSLDLPAQIVLSGDEFRRAVRATAKVSDVVIMGVEDDVFFMEAKGDLDSARMELTKDKLMEFKTSNVRSLYPLDYLSDMSKPISKAKKVCIDIGKDYPLKISFSIAEDMGKVTYLLAPRIEAD